MARQKPITVGKGTGYTRPRADGKNPRPVSAKPSDAGKKRAAQKTTTSGITRRPDGKVQPEGRAVRSSISKAKVTSSEQTRPSGQRGIFEKPNPKVTTGRGGKVNVGQAIKNTAKLVGKAAGMAGRVGRAGSLAGVAAEGLTARNTADATMKGKPTGNPQGPAVPKRLTKAGVDKGSFDKAFKAARSGGAKTFTWRGKKYNTKLKGE